MLELLHESIRPANLPYTIFLVLVMLYWITVFLGALDLDFLDFDVDADFDADIDIDVDVDVDVDIDADVDADVDADADGGGGTGGAGWLVTTASFLNIGKVPFMIFFSFLALAMWSYSVMGNYYLPDNGWLPLILVVPVLLMALLTAKLFTTPFVSSYAKMNASGPKNKSLVGKICTVTLDVRPGKKGQANLEVNGDHFLLKIKGQNELATLKKGDKALIVELEEETETFLVTEFNV